MKSAVEPYLTTKIGNLGVEALAGQHRLKARLQRLNTTSPAAAWYFPFICISFFALAERKNEIQKEDEVPLRWFNHCQQRLSV